MIYFYHGMDLFFSSLHGIVFRYGFACSIRPFFSLFPVLLSFGTEHDKRMLGG